MSERRFLSRHARAIGLSGIAALLALASMAPAWGEKHRPRGDAAFGEYLSSLCVTCHQASGQATAGIPPIVAWPEDQFIAVMHSYRDKQRENIVMQNIAAPLSDEEIAALAAYFGGLAIRPKIQ
ncbi:c-type cytochrome [Rhabdaerophilum calidifontis]|uniref:c-type cytochrome n=1 Tax=Rhabdaerophilum calidifontis TaxID=2604328 RepID=UPI00197E9889|nr:c-type cytochrome [Rhabdaerophilum calidifontis]